MKPLHYAILYSEKESADEIKLKDGTNLWKDTTYEPEKNAVQKLKVIEPALKWNDYDIKSGDFVYVHHFICMNDSSYVYDKEQGYYNCPKDFVYARVRNGKLKMLGNWNFVKPIKEEGPKTESGIYTTPNTEVEVFQQGILTYMSEGMNKLDVKIGDRIGFSKNSEYDMDIEGETLYRMRDKDILYKVEI